MFEKTAINPALVQSIEQVYVLRQIATQFFVKNRVQQLSMQTDVERARLTVALVDVLKRADRLGKVLILTQFSRVLEQIELSFGLHTALDLQFINPSLQVKDINFITYAQFFNIVGYDNHHVEIFLNQFDLIIVDDIENEKNEIFRRKLTGYSNWLLMVYVPPTEFISIG